MNPSNQPEPKQPQVTFPVDYVVFEANIKGTKQNTPLKESIAPIISPTTDSSISDAQAEVGRPALLPKPEPGLATTIKGQLSRAYYNGLDKKGWSLYEEKDAVDIILADLEADKVAAVVEERKWSLANAQKMASGNWNPELGVNAAEERLARLQPPTAGEGEAV